MWQVRAQEDHEEWVAAADVAGEKPSVWMRRWLRFGASVDLGRGAVPAPPVGVESRRPSARVDPYPLAARR